MEAFNRYIAYDPCLDKPLFNHISHQHTICLFAGQHLKTVSMT